MIASSDSITARGEGVVHAGGVQRGFARAFLLGNSLTFVTYALGTALLFVLCPLGAAIYLAYCVAATVAIWGTVCVHCPHYGKVCGCGYSTAASILFKKGDVRLLPKRYKLIWLFVAPSWLIPPLAAAPVVLLRFSWTLLVLLAAFLVVALALAPMISPRLGCCEYWRGCPMPLNDAQGQGGL